MGPTGRGNAPALPASYLRRLPKAELHCHLEGSVPAALAVAMAERNGAGLPSTDPSALYRFETLEEFLVIYVAVSRAMQTTRDFEEVAYTSLTEAAEGGLRYREIAFNPSNHPALGYEAMLEGILKGCKAAERDTGVVSRIVVAINRELGGQCATDLVHEVVDHPRDEVVGIGLDHNELVARPGEFARAFDLGHRAGLRLTAHAGERGDATEIAECLDVLKVDRIDHGYAVLGDGPLLDRCVQQQTPFAACWIVDFPEGLVEDRRRDMEAMIGAGLNISISSDDPAMIGSHIVADYEDAAARLRWTVADAERFSLAGLDGCFADDATASELRRAFRSTLDRIRPAGEVDAPASA